MDVARLDIETEGGKGDIVRAIYRSSGSNPTYKFAYPRKEADCMLYRRFKLHPNIDN